MSHERRRRRTLAVLACVAVMAVSTGCRRSPFQRPANGPLPEPSPAGAQPEPLGTAPGADAPPRQFLPARAVALPPPMTPPQAETFPLTPIQPQAETFSLTPIQPGSETMADRFTPSATPLLDAALKRAAAQERAQQEACHPSKPLAPPATASRPLGPPAATVTKPKEPVTPSQQPPRLSQTAASKPRGKPVGSEPKPPARPREIREERKGPDNPWAAPGAVEPADPAVSWRKCLERLQQIARESANRPGSGDRAAWWQVRAQVVDWLSHEPTLPANQALLQAAVSTIADAPPHPWGVGPAPAQDDPSRAAEIRSAVCALEDRVPLGITELRLCRKVLGFGAFEPLDSQDLKAGQPFLIYCELTGLRYQAKDGAFVSRLASRVELVAAKNGAKIWEQALDEAEDCCRRRRRDYYVTSRITFPPTMAPGAYRLRLTQADLLAHRSTSSELPVTITR